MPKSEVMRVEGMQQKISPIYIKWSIQSQYMQQKKIWITFKRN